jgi:hypothetical protein
MSNRNCTRLDVVSIASNIQNISLALHGLTRLYGSNELIESVIDELSAESEKLDMLVTSNGIIKGLPLMPNTSNHES